MSVSHGEVFKDEALEYRWNAKRKGRIVACAGEGYKNKGAALRALRKNGPSDLAEKVVGVEKGKKKT
jgi:uncharacterized protein YegP (UPF0339 family)